MFDASQFCHIASNARNRQKVAVFLYRNDGLDTPTVPGFFDSKATELNKGDIIIVTKPPVPPYLAVEYNLYQVIEKTLDTVGVRQINSTPENQLIALKADKTTDFESPITATNKGATMNEINDLVSRITGVEQDLTAQLEQAVQNLTSNINTKATKATDFVTPITEDNKGLTVNDVPQQISHLVTLDTDQTITGQKTFASSHISKPNLTAILAGIKNSPNVSNSVLNVLWQNNEYLGSLKAGTTQSAPFLGLEMGALANRVLLGLVQQTDSDDIIGVAPATPASANQQEIATAAWVRALLAQDANPAGAVIAYAGATAPAGYLICDGSAVSRTTYSALFAAIGTTYGAGDDNSTFNLPNLLGRVPFGMDGTYRGVISNGLLPNITGNFSLRGVQNTAAGCFTRAIDGSAPSAGVGSNAESTGYNYFDASKSSQIYGGNGTTSPKWYDGTRVIPSSVAMLYIIKY